MDNIRSLKKGQQYTLCGFTLGGRPYFTRFRLVKMRCDSADYADTYTLTVKAGICRFTLIRLEPEKQFIIWEGYHTPNINLVVNKKTRDYDSGPIETCATWPLWDPRYLERARNSVLDKPLVVHINKPVHDHGVLFQQ